MSNSYRQLKRRMRRVILPPRYIPIQLLEHSVNTTKDLSAGYNKPVVGLNHHNDTTVALIQV